jgi:hypothetical protein
MQIDSKALYTTQKEGGQKYSEAKHCKMVIDCMNDNGTMSAFCVKAGIGDSTFYKWMNKYDNFMSCYRIGCMIARENWEREGEDGKGDESFDIDLWKTQGAARYGVGKTNRVRVHIDADSTPYDQYKQLLTQASMGDFTASELKQLMESINIGIRAYETFQLQKEVDAMRQDLTKMSHDNGNNIVPIKTA